jgi:hypothetical protein
LMSATHYTWSDMKRISAEPTAKKGIDAAKAAEFKAVAKELETRDPAGYETFTGRGERTAPALLGVLVVLCMGLFIGLAMLMVLIGRVMMQGLALAAPLAAVLGVLPTHTPVLSRLWDLFTAAIVAVGKFVIAGGVMALVLAAIQANDDVGAGAKLFWVIVATVVGLVLTRPIRSFKTIVPGLDPNQSYLRTAMSGVASYVGTRVGTEDGAAEGVRSSFTPAETAGQPTAAVTGVSPDARDSLEPLPQPAWASSPGADPVWTQTSTAIAGSTIPGPTAGVGSSDWNRGQSWPGVVAGGPARAQLTAAPVPLRPAPGEAGGNVRSDGIPVPALTSGQDTVVDAPVVGPSPAATGSFPAGRPDWAQRSRPGAPAVGGTEVVFPTGVIVAAEEHPLYQRSTTAGHEPSELYLTMPEAELAPDGSEHEMVAYRRGDRAYA